MKWFLNEESGQGMIEYVLIAALIAIAAIVAMTALGTKINTSFSRMDSTLT